MIHGSGFAGIDNPLFYDPKTALLFGDAKQSVSDLTAEVQDLEALRSRPVAGRSDQRASVPAEACESAPFGTPEELSQAQRA